MSTYSSTSALPGTMRAALYHRIGQPFLIDSVDRPRPRPSEVLVQVKACGLVPNYLNVLETVASHPGLCAPKLPAIYGLDPAGIIVEKGALVHGLDIGDRVYVNPLRYCGGCRACRRGAYAACDYAALNGYFGFGPKAAQTLLDYPSGGFAEYMTAPQTSIVKLPVSLPFEIAARMGYLGTGYAAVQAGNVGTGSTVLINGASGTLGLGAVLFSLALGASSIFAVGRNSGLLDRVKALSPNRIKILSVSNPDAIEPWVRAETDGQGADVVIDTLPTGASPETFIGAFRALARGGVHVNAGGVFDPVPMHMLALVSNAQSLIGSSWFTTTQGQEMADMAAVAQVNFTVFDTKVFALDRINEALAEIKFGCGGFTNYVIAP